ncbi:MAG: ATP-binding protein [Candidatus Bipolaricaulota bacterium]|nr:ATP-binding protein [Candidatus Bipolaricaulota bacterium]
MSEGSFSLKSLRVQGYKILKDFALEDIRPLNVIVGPNGCGKSALWEVMTLLPDLARGPQAIFDVDSFLQQIFYSYRSRFGFRSVLHRESQYLGLELSLQSDQQIYSYVLRLAQDPMHSARCDTIEERLSISRKNLLLYEGSRAYNEKGFPAPKKYHAVINGQETEILWPHHHPLLLLNAPNDQLAQDPLFQKLRGYFQSWRGFKPVFPHLLGRRGYEGVDAFVPGEQLGIHMGNLFQVLWHLKNHDEAKFQDIEEIFLVAIDADPDSYYLVVEEENEQIKIWLGGAAWPEGKYWLGDWPDGWKAFLSWLVALRTAPGGVIFLEEPENNLHPRLLAQLLEQIRLANKRGVQVFLSTHSMELVNSIEIEELILMKDGQAYRVDPEKADKIEETGILLGSAWVGGFLEHFSKPTTPTVASQ